MSLNYLTLDQAKTELNCRCNDLTIDGDLLVNSNNLNSFTPVFRSSNNNLVATYTIQRGRYVTIGKICFYNYHVGGTVTAGSGSLYISSPVVSININTASIGSVLKVSNDPDITAYKNLVSQTVQNTDNLSFNQQSANGASVLVGVANTSFEFKGTIVIIMQ